MAAKAEDFKPNQQVTISKDKKVLGREQASLAGQEGRIRYVNSSSASAGVKFASGVKILPLYVLTLRKT